MDNNETFVVRTTAKLHGHHNHVVIGRPAAVRVVEQSLCEGQLIGEACRTVIRYFLEGSIPRASVLDRDDWSVGSIEPARQG